MNQSTTRTTLYAFGAAVILSLLIALGWFAFRQEPPPPDQQPVKVETAKPVAPASELAEDLPSETPTNQLNDSAITNAADLYRQAFALYDALTNDEREILRDWQTNVDASVESELCDKIHPICDLMHQASMVTNCEWETEPMDYSAKLYVLNHARPIAVAVVWSAAHCHLKDASGATQNILSILRVGRSFSDAAAIDCLTDIALQNIVSSYIAKNLESFHGEYAQLAAALNDPVYEQAPSRAIAHEADAIENLVKKLESLPATEAEKEFSEWTHLVSANPPEMDQATALAMLKRVVDSDRELVQALASSSEDAYESWQQHSTEFQGSSTLAKTLANYDQFVNKVRQAEVDRGMVVAGLAVVENGTEALPSHPDPSSEQPFVYTKTADGFELQSTYQVNGKPMTMQFK